MLMKACEMGNYKLVKQLMLAKVYVNTPNLVYLNLFRILIFEITLLLLISRVRAVWTLL